MSISEAVSRPTNARRTAISRLNAQGKEITDAAIAREIDRHALAE
jgi:hypothetical protein